MGSIKPEFSADEKCGLSQAIIVERFASQAQFDLLIHPKWGLKNLELTRKFEIALQVKFTWHGRFAVKKIQGVLLR